jgi:ADP-ribosyl-[dinitrogen reductase] hydrolase
MTTKVSDEEEGSRPILDTHVRGTLLGLAVGDALGTTHEFKRLKAPPFPRLADGPLKSIVGGGPFELEPGQVTDDTQMAVCLSDSLMASGGLDVDDVARRYAEWMDYAFDIGAQTSAALQLVRAGVPARAAGKRVWIERDRRPAGNGSLMRTAPIGVFVADEQARRRASLLESAITHFDPRCQLACAMFNAAIAVGIRGASAESMCDAAASELAPAARLLLAEQPELSADVAEAKRLLTIDVDTARQDDPLLYGPELHLLDQEGYVRVAFRLAFWHLLHTPDTKSALIDTANRGGDADTNSAIVGALLGACHGDDGLPVDWCDLVLGALQGGEPTPLAGQYHPRQFMEVIDKFSRGSR